MGRFLSVWRGHYDGEWYRVCAGFVFVGGYGPDRRQRGQVYIEQMRLDGYTYHYKYESAYPPQEHGPLTFTSVSADRRYFGVRAEDGAEFVFDLATRQFISGPGVVTPVPGSTATPTPTPPRPGQGP